jgi:hypothetical protein
VKHLDPAKSEEFRQWLAAIKTAIDDIDDVAEDAIRPLRRRRLGPVEHKRLFMEARGQLDELVRYAMPAGDPTPDAGPSRG